MLSMLLGIIITGIVIYTSVLYKSTSLVLLGCMGILLLISVGVFLIYRVHKIQCSILFPISIAECGKPIRVRILVDNQSFLPCMKLWCRLEQRNHFLNKNRKKKKWLRADMAVPGSNSYYYTITIKDYGSYELSITKIRIYDLTGLFYLHKRMHSSDSVQVLPQMQEIGVHITEATRNFFGDADVYDDFRPGNDHSELFQVRSFQNGDKIQSIHWKLSAKLDELLVREDSMPKACPIAFLLDYKQEKQSKMESVNAYLMILSSIVFSLMDSGCPHYAAWYSHRREDIVRVRIDDEEGLYLFLSCYLEDQFQKWEGNLDRMYREKYRGEPILFMLELNEKLELSKNQEMIMRFSRKNWKQELDGLDIIL